MHCGISVRAIVSKGRFAVGRGRSSMCFPMPQKLTQIRDFGACSEVPITRTFLVMPASENLHIRRHSVMCSLIRHV